MLQIDLNQRFHSRGCLLNFEDDLFVVEGAIEPNAGASGSDRGGQLLQNPLQKIPGPRGGVHVACSELHSQTQTAAPLAGEDRGVGRLAMASFGDVTQRGAFLRTVGDQRGGIGIDNGAVEKAQALEDFVTESIVGQLQTLELLWTEAPQKSSQSVAMREVGEAEDGWDQAVVNQALSALYSARASHNGKEVSKEKIHGMIVAVMVIGPTHVELQEAA